MNKHLLQPTPDRIHLTITETKLAWIAGLLEGEGIFHVQWKQPASKPPWPSVHVACNMTDEDVIRKLHEWVGTGTVSGPHHRKTPYGTAAKPRWHWQLSKRAEVYDLCLQLKPLLGSRRQEQVQTLLDAYESCLDRRKGRDVHNQGTYVNRGCRCEVCRQANRDYWRIINSMTP